MNRRNALRQIGTTASVSLLGGFPAFSFARDSKRSEMGIVTYAFGNHARNKWDGRNRGLCHAIALLEECHRIGAGGIQVDFKKPDIPHLDNLRKLSEKYGMHVEAIVQPPRDKSDVGRFEQDIENAIKAGTRIARTTIIPGRRYERFESMEEFREFEKLGEQKLVLAEPVLKRHKFRLAVENHKDHRTWERLALLKRINSESIGVCVDFGNNFALMEDPVAAVSDFAPYAFTAHIKDQAIREHEEGFWLADVPLGDGFLDLPAMVGILQKANPRIRFYYETITRDPIKVPVLTDGFWSTMRDTPATELVRTLRLLRSNSHVKPFTIVSGLRPGDKLALEHSGITKSLNYAAKVLGL